METFDKSRSVRSLPAMAMKAYKRKGASASLKPRRFIGVRRRQSGRWVAEIKDCTQKIRIWLGTYNDAEDAARAYDDAARALRGVNTRTNFPPSKDGPSKAVTILLKRACPGGAAKKGVSLSSDSQVSNPSGNSLSSDSKMSSLSEVSSECKSPPKTVFEPQEEALKLLVAKQEEVEIDPCSQFSPNSTLDCSSRDAGQSSPESSHDSQCDDHLMGSEPLNSVNSQDDDVMGTALNSVDSYDDDLGLGSAFNSVDLSCLGGRKEIPAEETLIPRSSSNSWCTSELESEDRFTKVFLEMYTQLSLKRKALEEDSSDARCRSSSGPCGSYGLPINMACNSDGMIQEDIFRPASSPVYSITPLQGSNLTQLEHIEDQIDSVCPSFNASPFGQQVEAQMDVFRQSIEEWNLLSSPVEVSAGCPQRLMRSVSECLQSPGADQLTREPWWNMWNSTEVC